jgi:hypothetical protein
LLVLETAGERSNARRRFLVSGLIASPLWQAPMMAADSTPQEKPRRVSALQPERLRHGDFGIQVESASASCDVPSTAWSVVFV